jgi:2-phospho-L-lactate guanylyltransferase
MTGHPTGWTVIVPVKPWRLAKSRLQLDRGAREALARAFALDVLAALVDAAGVETIVLVSAEEDLRRAARGLGVELLADRPLRSLDPLNDAIATGRHWAAQRRPTSPVAALVSDLPTLTGKVVTTALALAGDHSASFVPDACGSGTTMAASTEPGSLVTAFGPASARRHAELGLTSLVEADPRIRRDVDDTTDLEAADTLGLGRHSQDVVTSLLLRQSRSRRSLA